MAARLGMSLDEVKVKTSASQFVFWQYFLDWELTESFNRQDYYLAQIAQKLENLFQTKLKTPKFVQLKDMLLKFASERKSKKKKLPVDEQARVNREKNFFFGLVGMIGKGKKGR